MGIVLRPAESADVGDLVDLNHVVHGAHAIAEPGYFRADVDRAELHVFFENLLSSRDSVVHLAELDGRPVGYVWFDVQSRPATPFTRPQRRLGIHHLVVCEHARRRGVASALLHTAVAYAEAEGIRDVILNTWSFNEGAQAFFCAAGFDPMSVAMRRNLPSS